MHGHGDTEITAADEVYSSAVGIDAAVALAASLPYVDKDKIGITGHSSGGAACDMEIAIDNERENPIVSAVLFQASTWCDVQTKPANILIFPKVDRNIAC